MITSLRFSILEVTLSTSSKTAISSTLSQHCWVCEQQDEPEQKGVLEERLRDIQFKTCALPKCKFLQNSSLKHRISFHLSKYSVGQQCWWQHFSFWGQSSWLLHSFNVRKHTPLLTCLTLKQKKSNPYFKDFVSVTNSFDG